LVNAAVESALIVAPGQFDRQVAQHVHGDIRDQALEPKRIIPL
jgi:hypothetical protein